MICAYLGGLVNFRSLAAVTAAVCAILTVVWAAAPQLIPWVWGVDFNYPVGLMGRRTSAMFAGFGAIAFLARNAEPSAARTAIAQGLTLGLAGLGLCGAYELLSGHAGPWIIPSIIVEWGLAVGFFLRGQ